MPPDSLGFIGFITVSSPLWACFPGAQLFWPRAAVLARRSLLVYTTEAVIAFGREATPGTDPMLRSLIATVAFAAAAVFMTVATTTANAAPLTYVYGNYGTVATSIFSATVGYVNGIQNNTFVSQGFTTGTGQLARHRASSWWSKTARSSRLPPPRARTTASMPIASA